jgi:hypothetical protein
MASSEHGDRMGLRIVIKMMKWRDKKSAYQTERPLLRRGIRRSIRMRNGLGLTKGQMKIKLHFRFHLIFQKSVKKVNSLVGQISRGGT